MKPSDILWISCLAAGAILSAKTARGDQPITSMRINSQVNRDVANHCRYAASIRGTILASQPAGNATNGAPAVSPNLDVEATLNCPNIEAVTINDNVMASGPLSRDQLVRVLERRATIVTPVSKGRCVYVPEFTLKGSDVVLVGVDSGCKRY